MCMHAPFCAYNIQAENNILPKSKIVAASPLYIDEDRVDK